MKCLICRRGATTPGTTDVVLDRDQAIIIIRDVPADVCEECDEYYLAEDVALEVERLADIALGGGAEVAVVRYPAAAA